MASVGCHLFTAPLVTLEKFFFFSFFQIKLRNRALSQGHYSEIYRLECIFAVYDYVMLGGEPRWFIWKLELNYVPPSVVLAHPRTLFM